MMEEKRYWELFHKAGDKDPPTPPEEKTIYLDLFQKIDMVIIMLSHMAEKMGIDRKELYVTALNVVREK